MIQILEKLKRASYNRKTYRVGLLQAKAYRILKSRTTKILEPFDISTIEWAFLGLLYDKASLRTKVAARELGVEAPFITALVSSLKKRSFVVEAKDPDDKRAKSLQLSDEGKLFVENTEKVVREGMRPLIQGASTTDLIGYLAVLEKIVTNEND